jgi:hypothetical protein
MPTTTNFYQVSSLDKSYAASRLFTNVPDSTSAKVFGSIALCALAHFAQKKAASIRGANKKPSFFIRMADRGVVVALAHSLASFAIDRDY